MVTTSSGGRLRAVLAEALGTGLLVTVVVGSGISAQRLSPADPGLQLLENSLATALALPVIILLLGPVSGAHLNPVITLLDAALAHREGRPRPPVLGYLAAQTLGAIAGAVLANLMFGVDPGWSGHDRLSGPAGLAEGVATAGLVLVVLGLVRSARGSSVPLAVGGYVGAAYWFTSSTAFANPAVTVGRAFTDSFAGIAPASVPGFVLAQLAGGAVGAALALSLYPARPLP